MSDFTFRLLCSNCGKRSRYVKIGYYGAKELIKTGWGSCGFAFYCPACTRTWQKRNGDRSMNDSFGNLGVIMDAMIDDCKDKYDALAGTGIEGRTA